MEEKAMKKNVGGIDRNIRLLAGSILILVALFVQLGTWWQIGLGAAGVIAILTGLTGL